MDAPSMVKVSGDTLIVTRVISGDQLYFDHEGNKTSETPNDFKLPNPATSSATDLSKFRIDLNLDEQKQKYFDDSTDGDQLPQCKIKRNYSCSNCTYFTQNPRRYLTHLRDIHGEKIVINECKQCLYASRHYQKLVRHMKMVHGSTDGINVPANSRRGRGARLKDPNKKKKVFDISDLSFPLDMSNTNPTNFLSSLIEKNAMFLAVAAQNNLVNLSHSVTATPSMEDHNNPNDNTSPIPTPTSTASGFAINNDLMSEMQKNKPYKCSVCEFTAQNREHLMDHEKSDHEKTKFFRCYKCSYVTHIKARFSKHEKYHSMPLIKCMQCDFRTPYKWNLDRHMKNHGGKGQFKCSTCNFTADIKQSLTVHEMNHHLSPASGPGGLKRRNKVGGTDFLDIDMEDDDDDVEGMSDDNKGPYLNFMDHYQNSSLSDCPSPTLSDSKESPSVHNIGDGASSPKKKRPIPNLIPIQSQAVTSTPVRRSPEPEVVCKIPGSGTVTDFAKLFVSGNLMNDTKDEHSSSAESTSSVNLKRKTASSSFFDKLCEKLITNVNKEDNNLECAACGYVAKSLSDYVLHQNHCGPKDEDEKPMNLSASGSFSGSNRCKYCRQRCKSSADLTSHLQKCTEAQQSSNEDPDEPKFMIQDSDNSEEAIVDDPNEPHSMENIVFVWNKLIEQSQMKNGSGKMESDNQNMNDSGDDDDGGSSSASPNKRNEIYFGIETASGYGEVTQTLQQAEQIPGATMKKVFKCPHCSFWASTASRFHVHIVGHLNKKPFECSLCSYRSNWRWDITKHIRLKTIRDPSHADAGVLMNDETGRRNYTKYNKYITLMKVPDASNESAKNITKTIDLGHTSKEEHFPSAVERQSPNSNIQQEQQQKLLDYNTMLQICQLNPKLLLQQQFLQQQQQMMLERSLNLEQRPLETDGQDTGSKSYKCKKCNFKDSNREVVLEHVKIHYRSADVQNSAPLVNDQQKDLTTEEIETHYRNTSTTITPVKHIDPIPTTSASAVSVTSIIPNVSTSISTISSGSIGLRAALNGGTQIGQNVSVNVSTPINNINNSNNTSTNSNSNLAIGSGGVKTGNINGEMDEASSKGISGPSLRGTSAPYRCGHCFQQSNWKHVIQRHCRLKHNGNILIELANNQLIGGGSGVDGRHNRRTKKVVQPDSTITMQPKPATVTTTMLSNINLSPQIQQTPISSTIVPEKKMIDEPINKIQFYTPPPPSMPAMVTTTSIISSPPPNVTQLAIPISLPNVPSQISIIPAAQIQHIQQMPQNEPPKTIMITPTIMSMPSTSTADSNKMHMPTVFESMEVSISPENVLHYQQAGLLKKGKRYKCMFCPYVTDSKSQFLYHKSFHKPRGEPFKCSFCSYNVTKKHLLNQHMKMHAEHRPINVISIDEDDEEEPEVEVKTENVLDLTNKMDVPVDKPKPLPAPLLQPVMEEKKIHYCSLCPARYLSVKEIKEHIQMHSESYQFKCNLCTYSAQQESYLRDHKIAHTSYYQEKTKEFQMKYASSKDYPQPKVIVIPPENGEPSHEANLNSDILKWVVFQSDFEAMITPSKLTKTNDEERQSAIESANNNLKIGIKNDDDHPTMTIEGKEKCPHCPFSTNSIDQLKSHMQHHGVGEGSVTRFKCEHCDFSVDQEEQLKDHIKLHFSAILSANNYANIDNNNLKLFSNLNMQNNHLKIFAYDKNTKNTDLIYSDDDKMDDEDEHENISSSSNNNNYNQDNINDSRNKNGDFYTDKNSVILNF